MSGHSPPGGDSPDLAPSWNQIVSAGTAGVICFALASIGFGIAITGPELSSNMPFLPHEVNQAVGRVFIGFGAVVTSAIGIYAIRDCARLWAKRVRFQGERGGSPP